MVGEGIVVRVEGGARVEVRRTWLIFLFVGVGTGGGEEGVIGR